MLVPQFAHAIQNDIGHAPLDHGIAPIHGMSPPFRFQPAFIIHDALHIGNLRSDDICGPS